MKEKQREMEEENRAQQEGHSDPESTISSLTVSSESEGRKTDSAKETCPESTEASCNSSGKRKSAGDGETGNTVAEKKPRLWSHESSDTSSFDDGGGKPSAQQGVNVDQLVSFSDITDSNKDSSSDGNSSSACQGNQPPNAAFQESDAAATGPSTVDPKPTTDRDNNHSDVVFAGRKRKSCKLNRSSNHQKRKSLKFELDYEEVFLKSNVPQILATTSGRIVAWNDFFLKVTGLTAKEINRLTIFSLVQPSKLSNLFEIVAAALRCGTLEMQTSEDSEEGTTNAVTVSREERTESCSDDSDEKPEALRPGGAAADGPSSKKGDKLSAITLPCASFGVRPKPMDGGSVESNTQQEYFTIKPLYMTVTLMADEDPRKRCFHCVLTDCPGTNGSLGRVTPELLSLLFQ